jgi:hypothetical protein
MPNPTNNPIPSLYDMSNATIGTKLEKKKRKKDKKKGDEEEEEDKLIYGWAKVPLKKKGDEEASVVCRSRRSLGLRDC